MENYIAWNMALAGSAKILMQALSRIDYNAGNRAPKIESIAVDKTSGVLPFKVVATVDAKDPEKDKLTYLWDLGNGVKKETTVPSSNIRLIRPVIMRFRLK